MTRGTRRARRWTPEAVLQLRYRIARARCWADVGVHYPDVGLGALRVVASQWGIETGFTTAGRRALGLERLHRAARLRRTGASWKQVARDCGWANARCALVAVRAATRKGLLAEVVQEQRPWSDAEIAVLRQRIAAATCWAEVLPHYPGMDTAALRYRADRAGIKTGFRPGRRDNTRDGLRIAQAIALRSIGMPWPQIATQLGGWASGDAVRYAVWRWLRARHTLLDADWAEAA